MAFQKYQSEQVQQLAPGFVEAYGRAGASIGQGIQALGSGIAHGIEVNAQKKQEEAKLQGQLAPYLKTDQRVQSVKQQLAAGWLKQDDKGNVYIPDEHKDKFDPAKAADAISFYNETGGDGSKLTGPALTKFATSFEAEKKYAAEQAGLEDKRIEKLKTLAEIRKMEAEAAEKYGKLGRGEIIGAFASGADMSTFSPSAGVQPPPSVLAGTPYETGGAGLASRGSNGSTPVANSGSILSNNVPAATFSVDTSAKNFSLTPGYGATPAPIGFTPERYQAGAPIAKSLKDATGSPTVSSPVEPTASPTKSGVTVSGAKVTPGVSPPPKIVTEPVKPGTTTADTSKSYLAEIPKIQQARVELDNVWQRDVSTFSANHNIALAMLASRGASAEEIKAANETANTRYKMMSERYSANVASLDSRLKAFQASADEARSATTAALTTEKANIELGQPLAEGQKAPEATAKATFDETIQSRIQSAGNVPGRSGGTMSTELRSNAQKKHTQIMRDYPTWYNVGLTTKGGDEYQYKLADYPSSAPMDATVRAKVDENVTGYNEGRAFLTQLLDAVNGTDEERVKNYLNRFLATTNKDEEFATGQMLGQFGVAAFRRAIVSGGNFSDADREYVQKIITQINTPNPFATKDYLKSQTIALAKFIDSKFRSGLASQGVRLDLDTAEKFLTREKDDVGLSELEASKKFYTAYHIDTKKTTVVNRGNEVLDPTELRQRSSDARNAGNTKLADILDNIIKENQKSKDDAAKKANAAAAKARGK